MNKNVYTFVNKILLRVNYDCSNVHIFSRIISPRSIEMACFSSGRGKKSRVM